MQIDRARLGLTEQVIFNLRGPKLGIHVRLVFAEKTTVLGFDSNDSIHSNQITRRFATWLSQKENHMTQYAGRISTKERRLGRLSTNDGWETRHSLSFKSASPFPKGEDQGEGLLSSLFPHNRNLAKRKIFSHSAAFARLNGTENKK